MKNDLLERKNPRLQGYNYSRKGVFFLTICTIDKQKLFCELDAGEHGVLRKFSKIGKVAETAIENISKIYKQVTIDKYVIMQNHIHMILILVNEDGSTMCSPTISGIIKQCKEYVTKQIGYSIWQKSFHDHIIRNEPEYQKIWQYINDNPQKWADDCYYN